MPALEASIEVVTCSLVSRYGVHVERAAMDGDNTFVPFSLSVFQLSFFPLFFLSFPFSLSFPSRSLCTLSTLLFL
jgi:hypothetical protein